MLNKPDSRTNSACADLCKTSVCVSVCVCVHACSHVMKLESEWLRKVGRGEREMIIGYMNCTINAEGNY